MFTPGLLENECVAVANPAYEFERVQRILEKKFVSNCTSLRCPELQFVGDTQILNKQNAPQFLLRLQGSDLD